MIYTWYPPKLQDYFLLQSHPDPPQTDIFHSAIIHYLINPILKIREMHCKVSRVPADLYTEFIHYTYMEGMGQVPGKKLEFPDSSIG